jgi:hypothetical protein
MLGIARPPKILTLEEPDVLDALAAPGNIRELFVRTVRIPGHVNQRSGGM